MKRISFRDNQGLCLTQAVLNGRKTMTRRVVIEQVEKDAMVRSSLCSNIDLMRREKIAYILKHSPYKVGEVVAIQQAYKDIPAIVVSSSYDCRKLTDTAGWTNKMFVKAKFMHHHIRITDVSVENLQDISDEDCIREGIWNMERNGKYFYDLKMNHEGYDTPRKAFAALIDKVSGRGTWDSNPLIWAYSFEIVD